MESDGRGVHPTVSTGRSAANSVSKRTVSATPYKSLSSVEQKRFRPPNESRLPTQNVSVPQTESVCPAKTFGNDKRVPFAHQKRSRPPNGSRLPSKNVRERQTSPVCLPKTLPGNKRKPPAPQKRPGPTNERRMARLASSRGPQAQETSGRHSMEFHTRFLIDVLPDISCASHPA